MLLVSVCSFKYFGLAKNSLLGQEGTIGILLNRIKALRAVWGGIGTIEAFLELDSLMDLITKHWVIYLQEK